MDINEHLAVNVMGWTREETFPGTFSYICDEIDAWRAIAGVDNIVMDCQHWAPMKRMSHAILCLDKMGDGAKLLRKEYSGGRLMWQCRVYTMDEDCIHSPHYADDLSPSEAISNAIAKATGWEPNVS